MDKAPSQNLQFFDNFQSASLDDRKWLPFYMPHWSAIERTRPRYDFQDGHLVLRIDPDQQPWCPEFDGDVRVSSIQTGQFSGPMGSGVGQHRFRQGLIVRQEQPEAQLYVPTYGHFEIRAKAQIHARNLIAFFMIGFERQPDDSGEITIMEIFGRNVRPEGVFVGQGVKQINDPRLVQDFEETFVSVNVADWHTYGCEWTPTGVAFYIDGTLIRKSDQSPNYPMILLVNIYELPSDSAKEREAPASLTVAYVRGLGLA